MKTQTLLWNSGELKSLKEEEEEEDLKTFLTAENQAVGFFPICSHRKQIKGAQKQPKKNSVTGRNEGKDLRALENEEEKR